MRFQRRWGSLQGYFHVREGLSSRWQFRRWTLFSSIGLERGRYARAGREGHAGLPRLVHRRSIGIEIGVELAPSQRVRSEVRLRVESAVCQVGVGVGFASARLMNPS